MKICDEKSIEHLNGKNLKIAIVFSCFNSSIGEKLLKNTIEELKKLHVSEKNIKIINVPGALEIPLATKLLIKQKKYDAIIAMGIIIKGETYHFELVSHESHRALMDLSLEYNYPIVFGILSTKTEKQARDRVTKSKLNKGREFAVAAVEMAQITKSLQKK